MKRIIMVLVLCASFFGCACTAEKEDTTTIHKEICTITESVKDGQYWLNTAEFDGDIYQFYTTRRKSGEWELTFKGYGRNAEVIDISCRAALADELNALVDDIKAQFPDCDIEFVEE